jgi:hypothetical protein
MKICDQSHTPSALHSEVSPVLDGHREEKITSRHASPGTVGRRRNNSNPFATSALERKGGVQDHGQTTLPLGKYRYQFWTSGSVWSTQKIFSPPRFDPWTVQPVVSRYAANVIRAAICTTLYSYKHWPKEIRLFWKPYYRTHNTSGKNGKVFPSHVMMAYREAEVLAHSLLTSTRDGGKKSA